MALEWTEQLSVGNATLDSDHRNLICMIHTVEHALRSGNGHILSHAFQRLLLCVGIHFSNEEKLAQAVDLPFDEKQKSNLHLRRELEYLWDELEAKRGIWSDAAVEHFSRVLKGWMVEHISRDDRCLKPALTAQPYYFKP